MGESVIIRLNDILMEFTLLINFFEDKLQKQITQDESPHTTKRASNNIFNFALQKSCLHSKNPMILRYSKLIAIISKEVYSFKSS